MKELENVKLLFATNWWDGPLYGLCEHENKICYYKVYEDEEWNEEKEEWGPRGFKVYEMEPWQIAYELYWHSIFVSNVYRNAKCKFEFEEKLKNERFYMKEKFNVPPFKMNFYKKRKKEWEDIDYSNNNVIGTFKY